MTDRAVIVTGPGGGIGKAIARQLRSEGYFVVGIGQRPTVTDCDAYVQFDLSLCEFSDEFQANCLDLIERDLEGRELSGLVNNAALQILGATRSISVRDWQRTLAVNLTAPFLLSQAFAGHLEKSNGAVVNVGSVHADATKPEFVAYATSKAALHGLTRSLAVDLGGKVRVCTVAPAAISTEMLEAGFEARQDERRLLDEFHPAKRIGDPVEVARAVSFLLDKRLPFQTGSTLTLDGGILSRLHDPS